VICSIFFSTSALAESVNSGVKSVDVYNYHYEYYSSISSSSGTVSGTTTAQVAKDGVVNGSAPAGYMGVYPRLYDSSGTLIKSGSWGYTPSTSSAIVSTRLDAPDRGTYYSKGQVRFYNGNGYDTYTTNATPNMQQSSTYALATHQINENNMTYGSALFLDVELDLIQAKGVSGHLGYVKSSDLEGKVPTSLQEALLLEYYTPPFREIPLYAEDGNTIIDTFIIEKTVVIGH